MDSVSSSNPACGLSSSDVSTAFPEELLKMSIKMPLGTSSSASARRLSELVSSSAECERFSARRACDSTRFPETAPSVVPAVEHQT